MVLGGLVDPRAVDRNRREAECAVVVDEQRRQDIMEDILGLLEETDLDRVRDIVDRRGGGKGVSLDRIVVAADISVERKATTGCDARGVKKVSHRRGQPQQEVSTARAGGQGSDEECRDEHYSSSIDTGRVDTRAQSVDRWVRQIGRWQLAMAKHVGSSG